MTLSDGAHGVTTIPDDQRSQASVVVHDYRFLPSMYDSLMFKQACSDHRVCLVALYVFRPIVEWDPLHMRQHVELRCA